MKINKILSSFILFVFGGILLFASSQLDNPGGETYGASFFPSIIAYLLMFFSAFHAALTWYSQKKVSKIVWVEWSAWTKERHLVGRFLYIPFIVFIYVYTIDFLGFILVSFLTLLSLFVMLNVNVYKAALIAFITALMVYFLFYTGLRVPLPLGSLFHG